MASPLTANQEPAERDSNQKSPQPHCVCMRMCVCVCVCARTCLVEPLLEDGHDPPVVSRSNVHGQVPTTAEGVTNT